jgi:hypothetical protein
MKEGECKQQSKSRLQWKIKSKEMKEGNCKKQQKTKRDIASCVLVSKAKKVYR